MKRPARIVLGVVLVPVALVALLVVGVVGYAFWPRHASASRLSRDLGTVLLDNAMDASAVCGPRVAALQGGSKASPPRVELLAWTRSHDTGDATAHVEGTGVDDLDRVVAPCAADVAFAYDCRRRDNGVSAPWSCELSAIRVVRKY